MTGWPLALATSSSRLTTRSMSAFVGLPQRTNTAPSVLKISQAMTITRAPVNGTPHRTQRSRAPASLDAPQNGAAKSSAFGAKGRSAPALALHGLGARTEPRLATAVRHVPGRELAQGGVGRARALEGLR